MWKDDDEEQPTPSDPDFWKANHGKQERQEKKASLKGKLLALKRQLLRSRVDAKNISTDDAGKQDDEKMRQERQKREAEAASHQAFHTLTLKEQEEQSSQTALKQDTPDTLITKEEERAQAQDQSKEEFQKEPG